ncbi:hypothetical protein DMUE_4182 [Dictyocoela muelleri]|nr:hypothetical protein DMUE_4182 [Dictyocoela muelleri]
MENGVLYTKQQVMMIKIVIFKKEDRKKKQIKLGDITMNKDRLNYIIFESSSKLRIFKIKMFINEQEYSGIIDTEATNSFLSNEIYIAHKLKPINEPNKVVLGNGTHVMSLGKTELRFKITNDKYKLLFTILEDLDNDIILGLDFLINQKVRIDIREMKFTKNETNLNLEKDDFYTKHYTPENTLFDNEKIKILNLKQDFKTKIEEHVDQFKSKKINWVKFLIINSKYI